MSYRLEDTKRIKTQMITAVTHDLRTPLTSICGYVERLLDGKVRTEERKAEYYRIIYKKAKDIENIISDFTEFVKHENTLVFTRERILLKPFIQSLVDEYQEEFHFSGSHLKLRYDLKDDAKLCINEQLMRRVFVNLFSNALKHNDQPIEVTVRCYADREHIAITIEDTGKAVPADELPRIFERFYCVDKSRSRERGGSGLGLTICERIIDLHQGTIVAYLVPEGGLGFKIKLLRDSTK
ncbi:MAG: sensor histidine kinase, partial [Clostridia bacterium]